MKHRHTRKGWGGGVGNGACGQCDFPGVQARFLVQTTKRARMKKHEQVAVAASQLFLKSRLRCRLITPNVTCYHTAFAVAKSHSLRLLGGGAPERARKFGHEIRRKTGGLGVGAETHSLQATGME